MYHFWPNSNPFHITRKRKTLHTFLYLVKCRNEKEIIPPVLLGGAFPSIYLSRHFLKFEIAKSKWFKKLRIISNKFYVGGSEPPYFLLLKVALERFSPRKFSNPTARKCFFFSWNWEWLKPKMKKKKKKKKKKGTTSSQRKYYQKISASFQHRVQQD